jgi:uncharacterized protein with HEPN domain
MWLTKHMRESSPMHGGAAERQLGIIGEALNSARRLEPALSDKIPNLQDWVSLRHFIAHQYDRIDMQIIWETMTLEGELPLLIEMLNWLLAEDDPSGNE